MAQEMWLSVISWAKIMQSSQDSMLGQINPSPSIRLAFDEFEMMDLTL